ncbi:transposase [Streptomyces sp. NPDC055059]
MGAQGHQLDVVLATQRHRETRPAAPSRAGTAPGAARLRPRRQGLQLPRDPDLAATPRHRAHHPRAGGPSPQPAPARQPGGRPPAFDKQVYKRRDVVERCFNRLKQWRGIATRYDKTAESYKAAVTLASLLMWV